jgi:hypothetical protein
MDDILATCSDATGVIRTRQQCRHIAIDLRRLRRRPAARAASSIRDSFAAGSLVLPPSGCAIGSADRVSPRREPNPPGTAVGVGGTGRSRRWGERRRPGIRRQRHGITGVERLVAQSRREIRAAR